MRSRIPIFVSVAAAVVVALVVGVAVAGAGQTDPLPDLTAPELLAKMAQAQDDLAVSGDIAWQNGLFGDLSQAAGTMAPLPAQSPLLSDGSGRIWVSDAGLKVESQGNGGDQVVVVDKAARTAWVYDDAQNTVEKVVVTGAEPAETSSPSPSATMVAPDEISRYLQELARFTTVEVSGQTKVAGRDTYQLRFTPVAQDTAVGYVQADIDGRSMVPLQLEIYAKGGTAPVVKFGFTSVSYDAVDAALFSFTPPVGAEVTVKTIDGDEMRAQRDQAQDATSGLSDAEKAEMDELVQGALLTRAEVADLVPYDLASSRDSSARPYRWGYVFGPGGPLGGDGTPLFEALAKVTGLDVAPPDAGTQSADAETTASGPTSVLVYGEGLGSITLAQTRTTPELRKQLEQAQQASQILGTTKVNGAEALEVGTPLGGVIVWQQGDTTVLAGGMVPMSDLRAFASSVR